MYNELRFVLEYAKLVSEQLGILAVKINSNNEKLSEEELYKLQELVEEYNEAIRLIESRWGGIKRAILTVLEVD